MDDYVNILKDSIDTSVYMKIFKNRNDALNKKSKIFYLN